jgi:transcriptional regulator with XRE-family HTH domain
MTAKETATRSVLWTNVTALMLVKYGEENLTRLARDTKIGPGTSSRMKQQETSVRVDTLEKIASFFEIEPWQLLAPHLGADLYELDDSRRLSPVYRYQKELVDRIGQRREGQAPTSRPKHK